MVLLCATVGRGASAAGAQKQPARVTLSWRTPVAAGCATEQEIQQRLERLTERRLAAHSEPSSFRILADVEPQAERWSARITLVDASGAARGTREVVTRSTDCQALDVTVVVVIATLLDNLQDEVDQSPSRESRGARLWGLGASLALGAGLAPRVWFGASAAFLVPLILPLSLDASAYLRAAELDEQGRGALVWGFHAGVSACPRLVRGRVGVLLCAGAQAGGMQATGVKLSGGEPAWRPLLLVGLEPRLLFALTEGLSGQLSIGANWVVVRPSFGWNIQGVGPIHLRSDRFALLARIGVIGFFM